MLHHRRKVPDRETLAAHLAAGMTIEHIAETYEVGIRALRMHLARYGLIEVRTSAARLAEALNRAPPPRTPRNGDIRFRDDRTTFIRDFYMGGNSFQLRQLSLPRVSMHVAAIAAKPTIGGAHGANR
ncbi:hypothetical protein AS026_21065 [Rhizobium altiplani]|uniref:Uncharacterized protein n=1 Tax=Rhizobium altiplani TaxID=1864509 RepID=A0A109J4A0_9HYPH|nr:hypothetical protein [Rhizobium altiplani]KWV42103.1 hypothetical protein AS026_21065 [Rhizobium altiplani]